MHGFINLIKQKGVSSNSALQSAKKKLQIKKAVQKIETKVKKNPENIKKTEIKKNTLTGKKK